MTKTIVANSDSLQELVMQMLALNDDYLVSPPVADRFSDSDAHIDEGEITIWIGKYTENKKLQSLRVHADRIGCAEPFAVAEVKRLAEDFGGAQSLEFSLLDDKRPDSFQELFNLYFSCGKRTNISATYQHIPAKLYESREMLEPLLSNCGVQYLLDDTLRILDIAEVQLELCITPERMARGYELMCLSGYMPTLGNGSDVRSFHTYVHRKAYDVARVYRGLTLEVGSSVRGSETEVVDADFSLVEETLRRNGFLIQGKTFEYDFEKIDVRSMRL